jgi:hypothetical protein
MSSFINKNNQNDEPKKRSNRNCLCNLGNFLPGLNFIVAKGKYRYDSKNDAITLEVRGPAQGLPAALPGALSDFLPAQPQSLNAKNREGIWKNLF